MIKLHRFCSTNKRLLYFNSCCSSPGTCRSPAAGDDAPSTPEPVGDDGGRGSLLAAIRNAGGAGKAGLKKAANRKVSVDECSFNKVVTS